MWWRQAAPIETAAAAAAAAAPPPATPASPSKTETAGAAPSTIAQRPPGGAPGPAASSFAEQSQAAFASGRAASSFRVGGGGGLSQRPPMKRTMSIGMDETFSLNPASKNVPQHVWENLGGQFALPHHFPTLGKGEGADGARRVGRQLRRLVHVPGLPLRRNWRFMKQHFLADLCAGLTCAVMLIPQGMAYMLMGSLPSIIGLHTATVAPFFFMVLGTTRNILSVGPVALASIYLPTALTELGLDPTSTDPADQMHRAAVGSALTFWIGIIFLIMSTFRLGSLIRFLSFSVMNGFTTACGLYVGLSQLKYILGVHPAHLRYHYSQFYWLATNLHEANPRTMALGFSALAFLLAIKFIKKRFPPTPERMQHLGFRIWRGVASFATLLVVVASALCAYFMEQHDKGIPTVGKIEPGLSEAAFPSWSRLGLSTTAVASQAVPLALLAFMETYSVGRKFAEENGVELDQNQDLFALGVGNLVSACFSTFVAAGSFGRTALAQEVGARSTMSNMWMALFIILTLSCLTGLLESIPLAVLGAVIESAVVSLIDFPEMRRALRVAPLSGVVMIITFLATFLLTIETGLLYGVGASLAILLYQLSSLTLSELGLEEDEGLRFVSLEDHPAACPVAKGIAVVRPIGSIFFGNAAAFHARIHRLLTTGANAEEEGNDEVEEDVAREEEEEEEKDALEAAGGGALQASESVLHHVLIDACAMRVLDLTALGSIADAVEEAGERGVAVVMTNLSHAVKKSIESCGLLEQLGGELVTMSTEEVYARLVALRKQEEEAAAAAVAREGKCSLVAARQPSRREWTDPEVRQTFQRALTQRWASPEARAALHGEPVA